MIARGGDDVRPGRPNTDDKKRAWLNIIIHLLSTVPYAPLQAHGIALPKRQRADGYRDPNLALKHIPTPF